MEVHSPLASRTRSSFSLFAHANRLPSDQICSDSLCSQHPLSLLHLVEELVGELGIRVLVHDIIN